MSDELRPLDAPPLDEHGDGRVDALFASSGPHAEHLGRGRRALWLLLAALPLNVAGLACCTLVPGTLLTLWAWSIVKRELVILEHGELPVRETLRLGRLDRFAKWMLGACGVLLLAQAYLLTTGFYQRMLLRLDLWLAGL